MITTRLRRIFLERPEFLLALSLSAPSHRSESGQHSVTVTYEDHDVLIRARRPAQQSLRLACTKDTISAAILMHHVLAERGPDFAQDLMRMVSGFSRDAARTDFETPPNIACKVGQRQDFAMASVDFFRRLNTSEEDFGIAATKTAEAFEFLEKEELAIDPGFTPEFMVLAGLIPMHFSVRTPEGDRVYREYKVNAPLWHLAIERGFKRGESFTDVEFRFRGIEMVRSALTAMATRYLETEERMRRETGNRVVPRRGEPHIDNE